MARPRYHNDFATWHAWISSGTSLLGLAAPSIDPKVFPKDSPKTKEVWDYSQKLFRLYRGRLNGAAPYEVRLRISEASEAIAAGKKPVSIGR